MSTNAQIAGWGVAVLLPFMLNMKTKQSPDAVGLAGMLVLIWSFDRVLWALVGPPQSMALNPLLDSCAAIIAFSAWMSRPKWWKLGLVGLFVAQDCLHLAFWVGWPQYSKLISYIALNNLLFLGQLICVASPGGSHVARSVFGWVSHRPRNVHYPAP